MRCTGEDVLIVAEHLEGKIAPSTLELVAKGRELAASIGGVVRGALLGHDAKPLAGQLAAFGLEVLYADDPLLAEYTGAGYRQVLQSLLADAPPRAVLIAHTAQGYDLAPSLAGAGDLPLVANCVDVRFEGDRLVATRRLLNEKIQADFELSSDRPFVATLRPGSVPAAEPSEGGAVTPVEARLDASKVSAAFVGVDRPEVGDVDLASADVIVSAGRGIQMKENLALVEQLAKALGGVVGASRPLTDMEWLPKSRQVGQSGKTVRPKLYMACGISGAMQHVAGMKDAGLIIAVNTDPSAPIFEVAHVGVVADVLKFLPLVLKALSS